MYVSKSSSALSILKSLVVRFARGLIALVVSANYPLAMRVEVELKRSVGKGFGAKSIISEVQAATRLIGLSASSDLTFIDAGANVGEYSAAILRKFPNASVYSFEPSKTARLSLTQRFSNDPRVHISHLALGSARGHGELWSDFPGSGLASLTKRNLDHLGQPFNITEKVEVETLDYWCNANNLVPTFIKIDVEGHELEVLKGASEVLKSCRLVQFEFGGCNVDTRTYFRDFWILFASFDYTVYRVMPKSLRKIEFYTEHDETFVTTNYLAINNKISSP